MDEPGRILFATRHGVLDDSNGAAVSSRELIQVLAGRGFGVEVLSSTTLELDSEVDPVAWLAERGLTAEEGHGHSWNIDPRGVHPEVPPHLRLMAAGIPVTLHRGPTTRRHAPDDEECRDFLRLFERTFARFRPDVVLGYGGDRLQGRIFAEARRRGAVTVFNLHNFRYTSRSPFADIDAVRVPSRFAAEFYRRSLGLECVVLPNPVRRDRVGVEDRDPKYLTFVNPTLEKGVYAFARIAEELGRRRPDVPILVVEARGTERDVAACGLDLRGPGNVFFMDHTPDPRRFYRVSRALLVPSLFFESFGRVAAEAMVNGIPVLGSDRGALPETLGSSGIVLPLPDRLTPTTRVLPTAEEVQPWIEAIVRLWDDPDLRADLSRRARLEAERWDDAVLGPRYERFFQELRPSAGPSAMAPAD